ncbi:protein of unknown function [Pseudomonas sp. JV241A]|nr:protein of unknown function [Pseudomonas sp. JV241A]
MSRALVKPAEFQGMLGECARCHGGAPLSRKNKPHPVKAFLDLADEGFVGVLDSIKINGCPSTSIAIRARYRMELLVQELPAAG